MTEKQDKLKAEIEQLKAKLATYEAKLEGDGAIAQGQDSLAIGAGGLGVKGNINGDVVAPGGKLEKHYHVPEGASPQELRAAYLNHLMQIANQVQLSGIDPKTASDSESPLDLSAVYTALLTLSSEDHETLQNGARPDNERLMERGESRRAISALEQINRYPHCVLLGDPGSGKSTFVNYVAMCLAGEALQSKSANLAALTAPISMDDGNDDANQNQGEGAPSEAQPWEHGALIPIRIILRDFAARGLPPVGVTASAKTLWDFVAGELSSWALGKYNEPLNQELLEKGGLLLLDGLDEVPEAEQRRTQIKQAVEGFAASFPKCRIIVTSRIYAYQKQDWRLNNFSESILAPFSRGQIRSFVERWYTHISVLRHLNTEDASGRAKLLKRAIFSNDRLMELAERPLLLTLMSSLHAWRGGTLPEKREELYADAVDLLLDWWESPKVVFDASGELKVRQPSLAEWLKVDRQMVRGLLNQLAFKAHADQTELTGTADIPEGELVTGLMHLSQNPDVNPRQLVDYLSLRAGLLIPRGVRIFTFPHRTFQEYLAACYLTDHDYPEKVAELACTDINRWREVALLAGAKAARGTASAIWSLVDGLCFDDPTQVAAEKSQWGAHLAGQALVESGSFANISERNLPKHKRVQGWLVKVMETGQLPALERVRAGNALATLGDPRFDPEHWYLPKNADLGFTHIPPGIFFMGSDPKKDKFAQDREKPQHELDLPYDYWMAKYSVTVAQYRTFVKTSGYKTTDPDSLSGVVNHPVINVNWYDALEYAKWLDAQLKNLAKAQVEKGGTSIFWKGLVDGKLQVTVPSEAEWEKVARGSDGRIYPWGADANPNYANYDKTGIGSTSSVGAFPGGASPYGVLDMSGNVWEWTRTGWGKKYDLETKYPYNTKDGREDLTRETFKYIRILRGGAFDDIEGNVRCAYRSWGKPTGRDWFVGIRVAVSPISSH